MSVDVPIEAEAAETTLSNGVVSMDSSGGESALSISEMTKSASGRLIKGRSDEESSEQTSWNVCGSTGREGDWLLMADGSNNSKKNSFADDFFCGQRDVAEIAKCSSSTDGCCGRTCAESGISAGSGGKGEAVVEEGDSESELWWLFLLVVADGEADESIGTTKYNFRVQITV